MMKTLTCIIMLLLQALPKIQQIAYSINLRYCTKIHHTYWWIPASAIKLRLVCFWPTLRFTFVGINTRKTHYSYATTMNSHKQRRRYNAWIGSNVQFESRTMIFNRSNTTHRMSSVRQNVCNNWDDVKSRFCRARIARGWGGGWTPLAHCSDPQALVNFNPPRGTLQRLGPSSLLIEYFIIVIIIYRTRGPTQK